MSENVVHLRQPEARPDSDLYLELARRTSAVAEGIRHIRVLAARLKNPPLDDFFASTAEHAERFHKCSDGFSGAAAIAIELEQAARDPKGAA